MRLLISPRQSRLRYWVWQAHIYLGLATGLVLAILGLTGSLIVYLPELRRMVVPGGTKVEVRGQPLPLEASLRTWRSVRPADALRSLYLDGGDTMALNFRSTSHAGERIHTFIDQYTARPVFVHNYEHSPLEWFFRLHAELLAGEPGRWVDGWFGLALALLSLTGLLLWWRGLWQWKRGFAYDARATWRRKSWDWHNLAGFFSSALLFAISISGAYFSFPSTYKQITARLTATPAELPILRVSPLGSADWAPLDSVVRAAQAALPDGVPTMVNFPATTRDAITVRLKRPGDLHRIGYNYVVVDPNNAAVLRVERFDRQALGVRIIRFMVPLHYGTFGGTATRVLYVVLGLVPPLLFVTGCIMWWNRSARKRFERSPLTSQFGPSSPQSGPAVRNASEPAATPVTLKSSPRSLDPKESHAD
jgi:uncharacterized iron-regulated membrane protein